ncbi:MAG: hypothetical protein JWO30_3063 [Fibrobacteres bacterium]|nr:hypothetical protein [Fibrobacterota bacterium]
MSSLYRPKTTIQFPNEWAVNSFLLKLKSALGWEYLASSDEMQVKIKPRGGAEYILIGLNKGGSPITLNLNGEKLTQGSEAVWKEIFDYANRYRL